MYYNIDNADYYYPEYDFNTGVDQYFDWRYPRFGIFPFFGFGFGSRRSPFYGYRRYPFYGYRW